MTTHQGIAALDKELHALSQWGTTAAKARQPHPEDVEGNLKAARTAPKPPRGVLVYECCIDGIFEPIVCHLEYEPSEGDGYHLPISEPRMTLGAAYLLGNDIYDALDDDMVSQIEYRAMLELGAQAQEDAAEARLGARSRE